MTEEDKEKNPLDDDLLSQLSEDDPRRRLLAALIPDDAFSHEEAQARLPAYVTDELLGRPVHQLYPGLHRHLLHCQECATMYAAMIADVTQDSPLPASIPRPALGFLSSPQASSWGAMWGDVREATKEALREIIATAWPRLQDEASMMTRIFFRQLDQFGDDFILQPNAARAMGFGSGEVPLSQKLVAATYRSNMALKEKYAAAGKPLDEEMLQNAEDIAAQAATTMGLSMDESARFVAAYLAWLHEEIGS